MAFQDSDFVPILPYPSRATVAELLIALIERSSGAVLPDGWPRNEPYYLNREEALNYEVIREAIEGSISAAEPGGWFSEELAEFERLMVNDALEFLENGAAGKAVLDAIKSTARQRFRADPNAAQRETQDEDDYDDC